MSEFIYNVRDCQLLVRGPYIALVGVPCASENFKIHIIFKFSCDFFFSVFTPVGKEGFSDVTEKRAVFRKFLRKICGDFLINFSLVITKHRVVSAA